MERDRDRLPVDVDDEPRQSEQQGDRGYDPWAKQQRG